MTEKLRDIDIRKALDKRIRVKLGPDALIRHELTVGDRRMDVAALTDRFLGWEIKSDVDTLDRLDGQAVGYGFVFDHVTLVTTPKYAAKSLPLIPDWWEVITAEADPTAADGILFRGVRQGRRNEDVTTFGLAELLWRDEALALLREKGLGRGLSKLSRHHLHARLAAQLAVDELREEVLAILRGRDNWTGGELPGSFEQEVRLRYGGY